MHLRKSILQDDGVAEGALSYDKYREKGAEREKEREGGSNVKI